MNNFSANGFNERNTYIRNSNDINKIKKNNSTFDNSFAKMRSEERRNMVETTNNDAIFIIKEVRGKRENFVLRNNNIMNVNKKVNYDNPVQNALNRNKLKK